MTIGTTPTRDLSVNQIAGQALTLCGLLPFDHSITDPQYAGQLQKMKLFLDSIVERLATEGIGASSVSLYDITIAEGEDEYELPDTVLNVVGEGMFRTEDGDAETIVVQIDRETWHRSNLKNAEASRPTMMWVARDAFPVVLHTLTIPDSDGILRVQTHRLRATSSDGNSTMDAERYMSSYFEYELAAWVARASSLSPVTIRDLASTAKEFLQKAKGYANQHVENQAVLTHCSGHSRGHR